MAIRKLKNGQFASFRDSYQAGIIYSPSGTPVDPDTPGNATLYEIVKTSGVGVDTYTFTKVKDGFEGDLSGQMTGYACCTSHIIPQYLNDRQGDLASGYQLKVIDGKLYVDDAQYGNDSDWTFAAGKLYVSCLGFAIKGGRLYKLQSSTSVPSVSVLDDDTGWQALSSGLCLYGLEGSCAYAIKNGELYSISENAVEKISLYRDFKMVVGSSVKSTEVYETYGYALRSNGNLYKLSGNTVTGIGGNIVFLPYNGTSLSNITLADTAWISGLNIREAGNYNFNNYNEDNRRLLSLCGPNYLIQGGKLFDISLQDLSENAVGSSFVLRNLTEYEDWQKVWTDGVKIMAVRTGSNNFTSHVGRLIKVTLNGEEYQLKEGYSSLDDAIWLRQYFKNGVSSYRYIQLISDNSGNKRWINNDTLGSLGNVFARTNSFTTTQLPHDVGWSDMSGSVYNQLTVTGLMV